MRISLGEAREWRCPGLHTPFALYFVNISRPTLPRHCSAACLLFIVRTLKDVLVWGGGLAWQSPLLMFASGVLFAFAFMATSVAAAFFFLTKKYRPEAEGSRGRSRASAGTRNNRWGRGSRGWPKPNAAEQLVDWQPGAVRLGTFSGRGSEGVTRDTLQRMSPWADLQVDLRGQVCACPVPVPFSRTGGYATGQ